MKPAKLTVLSAKCLDTDFCCVFLDNMMKKTLQEINPL